MLKRLFYISATILMLAIAYHLGATNAFSQAPSPLRFVGEETYLQPYIATGDAVWSYSWGNRLWQPYSARNGASLPVPANQVLFCSDLVVITTSGEAFNNNGSGWTSDGFIPGGTINVQPETWTGVKEKYRK